MYLALGMAIHTKAVMWTPATGQHLCQLTLGVESNIKPKEAAVAELIAYLIIGPKDPDLLWGFSVYATTKAI